MGNSNSQDGSLKNGMSRNSSGVDLQEKSQHSMSPTDKVAKMLVQKTAVEDHISTGISDRIFIKYIMNAYPDLAMRVFNFMGVGHSGKANLRVIPESAYTQQTEKIISIISDKQLTQLYVSLYSEGPEINTEQMRDFLMVVYKIAMDHYVEGPQSCRFLFHTLQAVVDSAFHRKSTLSVGYLSNWLDDNCPRLVKLLHRYVSHVLTTSHLVINEKILDDKSGLELSTPVLEKPFPGFETNSSQPLLPVSQVWLLSMALPFLYTRPSHHSSPLSVNKPLSAKFLLAKMLDFSCPSHWTLLYNSNQHGLGANRFVYHVSNYRGPTLTFLRGDQGVEFCIGAPEEWRESHQYWGSEDTIVVQILPLYHILLRGSKSLYMNLSIRGYPLGIRAGSDPRKPVIDVNCAFNVVNYCGIPYQLESVEVWGCGTPQSRDVQLDIRKWEGKEVEKVRKVKLSANEWSDHPDRYLLELAGRPSYTSSS